MTTTVTRADLQKITSDPRVLRALEDLFRRVADTEGAITSGAEATQGIANATVITLSANDEFGNERVLAVSEPLALYDGGPGRNIIVGFSSPFAINGGFALTLNLSEDTTLDLPATGALVTQPFLGPYANDVAAAAAGVSVGYVYRRSDGTVAWRQS